MNRRFIINYFIYLLNFLFFLIEPPTNVCVYQKVFEVDAEGNSITSANPVPITAKVNTHIVKHWHAFLSTCISLFLYLTMFNRI